MHIFSKVYHSSWKFFHEMSFIADGNTEPDLDVTAMSWSTAEDGTDTPATKSQQPGRCKRRSSTAQDDTKTNPNLVYETAIQFMQQAPPPPPQDEGADDLFCEYVAGQLKLVTDTRSKLLIKARINNLFVTQQMEQIPPAAPSVQLNTPFLSSQEYGPNYYRIWNFVWTMKIFTCIFLKPPSQIQDKY